MRPAGSILNRFRITCDGSLLWMMDRSPWTTRPIRRIDRVQSTTNDSARLDSARQLCRQSPFYRAYLSTFFYLLIVSARTDGSNWRISTDAPWSIDTRASDSISHANSTGFLSSCAPSVFKDVLTSCLLRRNERKCQIVDRRKQNCVWPCCRLGLNVGL